MKFYYYEIADKRIIFFNGEISNTSFGFSHYGRKIGVEEIHYKQKNGCVSEVICEALNEEAARKAVNFWLTDLQ